MVNGRIKSILRKLIGPSKMELSTIIRESISISILKSGRTKQAGGALLSKVMRKSILRKSTLNHPSYLTWTVRLGQLSRRWCLIWGKSSKDCLRVMNYRSRKNWNNSWRLILRWISLNASLIDLDIMFNNYMFIAFFINKMMLNNQDLTW